MKNTLNASNPGEQKQMIDLIVTGDFCPARELLPMNPFSQEITELFHSTTYVIVNLEAPLTIRGKAIDKTGPNLRLSPEYAQILKDSGVNCVSLANNHIGDYGEDGVLDTIRYCKEAGLDIVGAGINLGEASKPLIADIDGHQVAILNYCEREFGIATISQAGANPYDTIDAVRSIRDLRSSYEKIVVIYHGGLEHLHYPTISMVKNFRFLVENGADAVFSHHTHAYSGYEYYNGKFIQYGLGNFFFSMKAKTYDKRWNSGVIVRHNLSMVSNNMNLIPVEQNQDIGIVNLCKSGTKEQLLDHVLEINEIVKTDSKLYDMWKEAYSKQSVKIYGLLLCPISLIRRILKKIGLTATTTRSHRVNMLNLFRCESHRDKVIWILSNSDNK